MNNKYKRIKLKVPSRYSFDIMNIHKTNLKEIGGGGIAMAIDLECNIELEIINECNDIIRCKKEKLVKFYLNLMRRVLGINEHFRIIVNFDSRIKSHNGMGSNAIVQTGIVYGINYMYGNLLSKKQLVSLIQKNNVEEENNEITNDVYCLGIGNNTIMFGGLCFIDENGELIYNKVVPDNWKLITVSCDIEEFNVQDTDKDDWVASYRKANDINNYSERKEKIIKEIIIPDLIQDKYDSFIEEMKVFALSDDSFAVSQKCKINDFTYNEFNKIIMNIPNLVMRISNNSPNICIITDKIVDLKKICEAYKIDFKIYDVNNSGIKVIEKEG